MRILIIFLSLLVVKNTNAGDEALYGQAPPPDAVFFRVVNLSNDDLVVSLSDKTLAQLSSNEVSPYGFASVGKANLSLNGQPLSLSGAVNSQYTIVYEAKDKTPMLVEEQPFDNKRQARLALYNFTDNTQLTLKTLDGKHVIVENVASASSAGRDVRAMKVATSIHNQSGQVAVTDALMLARDKVTSVILYGDSESPSVMVVQAEQ